MRQTPRFEYSRAKIAEKLEELTALSAPYGLTVRYAVKANPHKEILAMVREAGVHFDASSSYEAEELIAQGISGELISLSSQQSAHALEQLLSVGVRYVATSLHQLEQFILTPGRPDTVTVRINPDEGHGHNNRTSTGGVNASFGIWHEYVENVLQLAKSAKVTIDRLHIHVGSGADSEVWGRVMDRALEVVEQLPDVTTLNIGGGYKIHRFADEKETDMNAVLTAFSARLTAFAERTGRELHLEIEPGTYLIAHAGVLIAQIDDIVDTGENGHTFIRLNTGMNDFLRSAMYGARHEIEVVTEETDTKEYMVVGHNCESGDLFTPAPGNPELIETRTLKKASIGDEVRIYDVGAYCASMRAKGYNSFPDAIEIMVDKE